jgi:hypothetical protein
MSNVSFFVLSALFATASQAQQYTRVLIPIAANSLPGGFGSLWKTEFVGINDGDVFVPVKIAPDVVCTIPEGCPGAPAQPHQPFSLPGGSFNLSQGYFVYVESGHASDLHFHLQAYDITRRSSSFGAAVPVPSEDMFKTGPFSLLGLLIDPTFRTALRIYGLENLSGSARLRVSRLDLQVPDVQLQILIAPQFSPPLTVPSYGSVPDLAAALPAQFLAPGTADAPRLAIEVTSETGQRLWGFATVTNNSTQNVSIVSPE